jgi:hypothetical protein
MNFNSNQTSVLMQQLLDPIPTRSTILDFSYMNNPACANLLSNQCYFNYSVQIDRLKHKRKFSETIDLDQTLTEENVKKFHSESSYDQNVYFNFKQDSVNICFAQVQYTIPTTDSSLRHNLDHEPNYDSLYTASATNLLPKSTDPVWETHFDSEASGIPSYNTYHNLSYQDQQFEQQQESFYNFQSNCQQFLTQ